MVISIFWNNIFLYAFLIVLIKAISSWLGDPWTALVTSSIISVLLFIAFNYSLFLSSIFFSLFKSSSFLSSSFNPLLKNLFDGRVIKFSLFNCTYKFINYISPVKYLYLWKFSGNNADILAAFFCLNHTVFHFA